VSSNSAARGFTGSTQEPLQSDCPGPRVASDLSARARGREEEKRKVSNREAKRRWIGEEQRGVFKFLLSRFTGRRGGEVVEKSRGFKFPSASGKSAGEAEWSGEVGGSSRGGFFLNSSLCLLSQGGVRRGVVLWGRAEGVFEFLCLSKQSAAEARKCVGRGRL
jgi:hypothetical protein